MLNFQLGPIGSIFEPHHSLTKLGNKGSFKKNCDECDTKKGKPTKTKHSILGSVCPKQ